jgi:hypothetical protein
VGISRPQRYLSTEEISNMRLLAIAALASSLLSTAAIAAPTFTTIDDPADLTFNQLLGINNAGVISGYFGSGAAGHPNKGYRISPPYAKFVDENYPTSVQTQATGINNNGATTGFWSPTNLGGGDANYGFIRWTHKIKTPKGATTFITVNDPHTTSSPPVNQALGINDNSIAAGFYNDADGNSHGFAYTVSTGKFTEIKVPGNVSVAATGINANNLICGFVVDAAGKTQGFLKPLTGGNAIEFAVPKSKTTQFLGVNVSGMAVGFFVGKGKLPHGVLYNPGTGQWVQVDAPLGAQGTILNGINDNGDIVGFYMDNAGNTHGVLIHGE